MEDKNVKLEEKIGEVLHDLRKSDRKSLEELSGEINVSIPTLRNLEKGRGGTISLLIKVLDNLGELDLLEELINGNNYFNPIDLLKDK